MGIHKKVTILGPIVDPIPRPVTNAVVRIIPAVSCSSNPTFLGPSMSPTLPRYPPVRLNRAIKDTQATSEENQISVFLFKGAILHRIIRGIKAILATTARATPTSVHLPGFGHWVVVAINRPPQSHTDWTRKQLEKYKMITQKTRKTSYHTGTKYFSFQGEGSVETGLIRAVSAGCTESVIA